jgi:phosphoesterase RecJ-like protein
MKISSKLLNLIKKNKSFLIVGHINPEGDSIGSSLALALGLLKMGKKDVKVLSKDPVPEILKFLPGSKMIKQKPPRKEVDVLIIVDCNTIARTGFNNLRAKKTAIIDHHIKPANSAGSEFYRSLSASDIYPEAAAAGILVYKTLVGLKIPMDKKIGNSCLQDISWS